MKGGQAAAFLRREQRRAAPYLISAQISADKPTRSIQPDLPLRLVHSQQAEQEHAFLCALTCPDLKARLHILKRLTAFVPPLRLPYRLCLECALIAVFLLPTKPLIFLPPLWTDVCTALTANTLQRLQHMQ